MQKDELLEKRKITERIRRAKIKNDPVLHEQYKEKERQRYRRRKDQGKIKPLNEMSPARKNIMREKSRESSQKYRAKKLRKRVEEEPISTPDDIEYVEIENQDPLNLPQAPTDPLPTSSKSTIPVPRAAAPSPLSTPRTSRNSSPAPPSPMSASSISQRLRSKKLLLPRDGNTRDTPKKLLKASFLRKMRYQTDKERQLYNQKISKLKTEKDRYRKQLLRMRHKTRILQETIKTQKNIESSGMETDATDILSSQTTEPTIHKKVQLFYEDDENSRLCPGKKDTVTRNKIKKQKRYLTDSMQNLHKKFLIENPESNVGYSYFCKMRPFWVLIQNVGQRETCLCQNHENFELIVAALKNNNIIFEKNVQEVLGSLCCEGANEKCLSRSCEICKDNRLTYRDFDDTKDTHYYTWKKEKKFYTKDGEQKSAFQMAKHEVLAKPKELIAEFDKLLGPFMQHEANLISQRKYIKQLKANLLENQCIIHCDFSENYCTKYGTEIQSFHFGGSRKQISLHTSVLYYKKDGETRTQSFCTFSECLRHDAVAIWEHFQPLFRFIEQEIPQLESLFFISDSPSAQYRNRKMFFVMSTLHWNFPSLNCVEWNYTEVGHGKGAPDGVGGYIKRTADKIVACGKDINNLQSLLNYLKLQESKVMIDVVEEFHMRERDLLLPNDLHEFPGTFSVHQAIWNANNEKHLTMRKLSCGIEECLHRSIECHHGQHIGFYYFDKTNQKESTKTNRPGKNKSKNPKVVKSSKVKTVTGKKNNPPVSNTSYNKGNKTEAKSTQNTAVNDIEEDVPTYTINKKIDLPTSLQNNSQKSCRSSAKHTSTFIGKRSKQTLDETDADLEITESDSFWADVSVTDVEGIMTPTLTKTVVQKLTQVLQNVDTDTSGDESDNRLLKSPNNNLKAVSTTEPEIGVMEQDVALSSDDDDYNIF